MTLVEELQKCWETAEQNFPAGDPLRLHNAFRSVFTAGFVSAVAVMQRRIVGRADAEELLSLRDILDLAEYMTSTIRVVQEKPN